MVSVKGCNIGIMAAYIVNDLKHGTHARFMTIHSDGLSPGEGGTKESASISEIVRVSQVESFTIYSLFLLFLSSFSLLSPYTLS
jgi:hypothetical protein